MKNKLAWTFACLFVALIIMVMGIKASAAQAACSTYEKFANALAKKYDEYPLDSGIVHGEKAMITVFVSKKGSFTILFIPVSGLSCIVATGNGWDKAKTKVIHGEPS